MKINEKTGEVKARLVLKKIKSPEDGESDTNAQIVSTKLTAVLILVVRHLN